MKLMGQEFAELRERLYPMLMDPVQIQAKGEGNMLVGPLTEGLIVVYAIEEPNDKVRYVSYQDLRDWGISHTTVHVTAVKNLDRLTEGNRVAKIDRPEGGRPMFFWHLQDGYDAARILLPERLTEFAEAVPGRLVLGVPHRNWFVAIGDEDPELVALVRKRVQKDHREAEFPVSPYLYTWDDGQLTRYRKEA